MMLPDPLPIQPLRGPLSATLEIPGSKSITNRALILAALSPETITLRRALFSRDSDIMIRALRNLGFEIHTDDKNSEVVVTGRGGEIPADNAVIHVGNAGTAARFLTALVCLKRGGAFRFEGDLEMERRPMQGLLKSLPHAGWARVQFHQAEGFIPFTLHTRGISKEPVQIDPRESSQMLSALLLTGTAAKTPVTVSSFEKNFRQSYVRLTLGVIEEFGGKVETDGRGTTFTITPGLTMPPNRRYSIEPDASSASYFFAAPLVTPASFNFPGFTRFPGLQGDIRFLEVLKRSGIRFQTGSDSLQVSGDGDFEKAVSHDFYEISDTFLTYAALAPLYPNAAELSGLAHTRKQETDRVAGMATELKKLGVSVTEMRDRLQLVPDRPALKQLAHSSRPLIVKTYKDHRFAMSFAILGLHDLLEDGEPWLAIQDPHCSAKTFPQFFELFRSISSPPS